MIQPAQRAALWGWNLRPNEERLGRVFYLVQPAGAFGRWIA